MNNNIIDKKIESLQDLIKEKHIRYSNSRVGEYLTFNEEVIKILKQLRDLMNSNDFKEYVIFLKENGMFR